MSVIITILHVIVCFVLILVILLQAGRGQGLTGAAFGSGNVQSLFGTKASSFLTKATTVSAICFMLTCITLDVIEVQKSRSLFDSRKPAAPLDIDQIKKALEKVKSEGNAPAEADAAAAAAAVQKAVSDAAVPEALQAEGSDAVSTLQDAAAAVPAPTTPEPAKT
ncbi:MAG: preprotein translocase subunit SecG [Candidatus Omnitrophica bacterium]|nr:preprotein translocase subunit SecG [Candidatus Omnitrophota bacterium]